jgi:hypothetical protein
MRLTFACAGIVILLPLQLWAQTSTPEVFGHVGLFRAGSDEGSIGKATSFGGAITVPVFRRLAVNVDVQTSKVARIRTSDRFYRTRRTLILPGLLYRWGRDSAYGFVGGGIGAEIDDSVTREDNFIPDYTPVGWREIRPRVFEIARSRVERLGFAQVGFAAFPTRRLGMRVDFYVAEWHLGTRIGIGYRFD